MEDTNYTNKTLKEASRNVVIDCVGCCRTYNIGFNDGDETQFDVRNYSELAQCWNMFCKENGLNKNSVDYVEYVGLTEDVD